VAWPECFSDEVVVDFPSMADAVDRMRSPFLDDTSEPTIAAELSLTARQAFDGATLTLDLPLCWTCRTCGGRGEQWPDPCDGCGGSGTQSRPRRLQVFVPPRVADGTRFRFLVSPSGHPATRVDLRVTVR